MDRLVASSKADGATAELVEITVSDRYSVAVGRVPLVLATGIHAAICVGESQMRERHIIGAGHFNDVGVGDTGVAVQDRATIVGTLDGDAAILRLEPNVLDQMIRPCRRE